MDVRMYLHTRRYKYMYSCFRTRIYVCSFLVLDLLSFSGCETRAATPLKAPPVT